MRTAHRFGIAPDVFWGMTPWQLRQCTEESVEDTFDKHDHWIMIAYTLAGLIRHAFHAPKKPFPDIKTFQAERTAIAKGGDGKKPVSGINEDAILSWLQNADAVAKKKKGKQ